MTRRARGDTYEVRLDEPKKKESWSMEGACKARRDNPRKDTKTNGASKKLCRADVEACRTERGRSVGPKLRLEQLSGRHVKSKERLVEPKGRRLALKGRRLALSERRDTRENVSGSRDGNL